MPVSRKKRSFRRNRKRGIVKYRKKSYVVPRWTIPPSIFRRFHYTDRFVLNPGVSGALVSAIYRCNSIFDPDQSNSGTNDQPMGFDQYLSDDNSTGLYNKFVVLGAKITVTFYNSDTTGQSIVGISQREGTVPETDYLEYKEGDKQVSTVLGVEAAGNSIKTLSLDFSTARAFGKKPRDVLGERDLQGTYNANPTAQKYWHVWAVGAFDTDTQAIGCELRIDYIVQLRDPVQPNRST